MPNDVRPTPRRWWILLSGIALLALIAWYAYSVWTRNGGAEAGRSGAGRVQPPARVAAAEARTADLPIYLDGLGTVTPLNTVTVRSRVDGEVVEVRYVEGQIVQKGDVLAVIDPRPFEVQLTQAEGQLARDQALLRNAQMDLERNKSLFAHGDISKQEVDTQEALVSQYQGAVKADTGLVDNAQLQLQYSRIVAPLTGRAGLRLIDPGNIVRAADPNGIVVIAQIEPISVVFTIAEDELGQVMGKYRAGERMPVEAYDRDFRRKLADGALQAIDNQVDLGTGTVKLKALFPNADHALFPNGFVNARLVVDVLRGATVVPAAAIQRGPEKKTYVYVVRPGAPDAGDGPARPGAKDSGGRGPAGAAGGPSGPGGGSGGGRKGGEGPPPPSHHVEMRTIAVRQIEGAQAAIASGLEPGELVVVDGADRLRDNAPVNVNVQPPGGGSGATAEKAGGSPAEGSGRPVGSAAEKAGGGRASKGGR